MNQDRSSGIDYDVVVVGAGFSGSTIGLKAADLGAKVRLYDGRTEYPDLFRAEKLETDQHEALEQLGLIELVRPNEYSYIDHVHEFIGPRKRLVPCSKHRGINYRDTVNSFRDALAELNLLEINKVANLRDTEDCCELEMGDGSVVRARLAVIATGGSPIVRKSLNLKSHQPDALRSTSFGFYVAPSSVDGFPFDAFNLRSETHVPGFHYVTVFPVGSQTRVNVFTCWHPNSPEAKNFRSDPISAMHELFPHLKEQVGQFTVQGDVQVFTTHFYRQDCSHLRSTVVVADDYQSVSPTTGMGLSKCLTDAISLIPVIRRVAEQKYEPSDLRSFYDNEDKNRVDNMARNKWDWACELATSRALRTRIKALKRQLVASLRRSGLPLMSAK